MRKSTALHALEDAKRYASNQVRANELSYEARLAMFGDEHKLASAIEHGYEVYKDDVSDEVWHRIMSGIGLMESESVHDFHERLIELHGCRSCSEFGNNGCGSWQLDGIQFFVGGDGDLDESVECINASTCSKAERKAQEIAQAINDQRELEAYREQAKNGTLVFSAAIKEALKLMPVGWKTDCYGDIVRSAAAVACHRNGTEE